MTGVMSKSLQLVVRVTVMCAVGVTFVLTRGVGSILESFGVAVIAVVASHAAVLSLSMLNRSPARQPSRALAIGCAIFLLATAAAMVSLVRTSSGRGPLRYLEVDELLADPIGDELKLHGYVELGSLQHQLEDRALVHTFVLIAHKQRVAVRFTGTAPDTFQDRAEVVARGQLGRTADHSLLFIATEIIARCPTTYQTANGPRPASQFR